MTAKSITRLFWRPVRTTVAFAKSCRSAAELEVRKRAWIREQEKFGCQIAKDIEFSGLGPASGWLEMGRDVLLQKQITIWLSPYSSAPKLKIEDRVFVGQNVMLVAHEAISIGKNAMIGHYSHITSCNHNYQRRDIPIRDQGFVGEPVAVGEDVWIGTYAVILPGVVIGKGSIIAAGSVVTHNIPDYEVWGGVPARFIKRRD